MVQQSSFIAPWWCSNRHLQTLWGPFFRRTNATALTHERLELQDGDFLDLVWTARKDGPIVVMLHGLEGSSRSHYIPGMLETFHSHGWRAVLFHFRGCSGEHNRLPRAYHSGDTGDFAAVLRHIRVRDPDAPLVALGYSMGGNVLLKWLGETGSNNPLCAGIAVSPTFNLHLAAQALDQGFSRVYQWHLVRRLVDKMKMKSQTVSFPFHVTQVEMLNTFREFDDHITAPLHGFEGVDDYYSRSSCGPYLRDIRIPTLILHAKDDPFSSVEAIPTVDQLSPTTTLELSVHGGHVGFVQGSFPGKEGYWLEKRIPEFLSQYLTTEETPPDRYREV